MTKLTEQAGKIATTAIGALKGQPALLAMLLLNLLFITTVYFAVTASRDRQAKEFELIMQSCHGVSRTTP